MRLTHQAAITTAMLLGGPAVRAQAFNPTDYANSFRLHGVIEDQVLTLGTPLRLELLPLGSVERVEIIAAPVDLNLAFRHLQLTSVADNTVLGPFPPVTPPRVPATSPVEAWVAALTGELPIGFRVIREEVTVEARWLFTDGDGTALEEGLDIHAVDEGSPLVKTVLLAPRFTTWSVSASTSLEGALASVTGSTRKIQAEVRVRTATTGFTPWIKIPAEPIEVTLPRLPVPDVLLAFRNEDFGSNGLLLLPAASPLGDASDVREVVQTLRGTVDALEFFAQFTALGAAISTLASQLDDADITVRKRDSQNDLGDVTMIHESTLSCDWCNKNTRWNDRISSLVMISAGREVDFFEHDDHEGHRLTVDPRSRNVAARVATLHREIPSSSPAGAISLSDDTPDMNWGDKITSYRWQET